MILTAPLKIPYYMSTVIVVQVTAGDYEKTTLQNKIEALKKEVKSIRKNRFMSSQNSKRR